MLSIAKRTALAAPRGQFLRHASARAAAAPAVVDHAVGYWLLGCGGMVAGMVTVGGITRLTRSGLSMTDWKLQGSLPPMTAEAWEAEFARWKLSPEGTQRKSLSLDDFKFIYFWEYGHRMLGRTVGVAFGAPALYFAVRGRLSTAAPGLPPRVVGLFALGGSQGLIGWWMVRSGLSGEQWAEQQLAKRQEVRVSPYRLATHLGMAFTTYTLLLWTALDVLAPPARVAATQLALLAPPPAAAAAAAASAPRPASTLPPPAGAPACAVACSAATSLVSCHQTRAHSRACCAPSPPQSAPQCATTSSSSTTTQSSRAASAARHAAACEARHASSAALTSRPW